MLIHSLLTLLPCFFFMNWSARLLHQNDKSASQKSLLAVCILGAISFFGDASGMMKDIHYGEYAVMTLIMQASIFLLFRSFSNYLDTLEGRNPGKLSRILTAIPPVALPLLTIWSMSRIGFGGAVDYLRAYDFQDGDPVGFTGRGYDAYRFIVKDLHSMVIGGWIIGMWTKLLSILSRKGMTPKHLAAFLKGKRKERIINVMCLLSIVYFLTGIIRVLSGRLFLIDHPFLQAGLYTVLGLLETYILYIGYKYDGMNVSLETEETAKTGADGGMAKLAARLKGFVEEGKAYTDPDLSIERVADALATNRTYVSRAIKESTGGTFRDYINSMRVEAVKRELTEHPGSRLEEVAARTGFSSASQLVKKFRESTGETPKAWSRKQ